MMFIFLVLLAGSYSLVWAITCTPYFKDAQRLRSIAKQVALLAASFVMAVLLFSMLLGVDVFSNQS